MEKEAKKEAFRKYLESSGALDALTKDPKYYLSSLCSHFCMSCFANLFHITAVLVALYEQNDKPSSAIEFIQQKLGGPTMLEYEKLQTEISDLQIRYNELLAAHQEKSREYEELKNTNTQASLSGSTKDDSSSAKST